jgi:molybdopterin-guanine dinucleotide biosynthesis protein A
VSGPPNRTDPPALPVAVTGIVLAGGRSSRFGTDKLLTPLDGEPLLWRPIRALAGAGCGVVVVVIAPTGPAPDVPPDSGTDLRVVRDRDAFGGPLAGVRTGLGAAADAVALVAAGDQPGLRPGLLRVLLGAFAAPMDPGLPGGRSPAAAVLVDTAGVARPLPCAVDRAWALAAAERLLTAGESRLRALFEALDARAVPERDWRPADPGAEWTVDIDTPADLEGR